MTGEEAEHGDGDGGPRRQLGGGRCHVFGTVEDHLEAKTPVPGRVVRVVPCFQASDSILNRVGRDFTGVRGCICAEYKFIRRKAEMGWYLLLLAKAEEVVDVARVSG